MELPRKAASSPYIHPIQLPTECGDDLENVDVIAIGNGLTEMYLNSDDKRVRHIHQKTMSFKDCDHAEKKHGKTFDVICTSANVTHTIWHGDSGKQHNFYLSSV